MPKYGLAYTYPSMIAVEMLEETIAKRPFSKINGIFVNEKAIKNSFRGVVKLSQIGNIFVKSCGIRDPLIIALLGTKYFCLALSRRGKGGERSIFRF